MDGVEFRAGPYEGLLVQTQKTVFKAIRSLSQGVSLTLGQQLLRYRLHELQRTIDADSPSHRLAMKAESSDTRRAAIGNELVDLGRDLEQFLITIQDSRPSLRDTSISSRLKKRVLWAATGPGEIKKMLNLVEGYQARLSLLFGMLNLSLLQESQREISSTSSRNSVGSKFTVDASVVSEGSSWSGAGFNTSFARLATCSTSVLE